MGDFFISPQDVYLRLATADAPLVLDVRRREVFDSDDRLLPTARWCHHTEVAGWIAGHAAGQPGGQTQGGRLIVLACRHSHNVSQLAAADLRRLGYDARVLSDGVDGWKAAGFPTIAKSAISRAGKDQPTRWVTRRRPKIDRVACPWLISRFVDAQARFYFVEPDQVIPVAEELGAVPYDIESVEITHIGDGCSFDTLIERFGLVDPALEYLRLVVRGADTARFELAPEAAGLLAVSLGLSVAAGADDHVMLASGFAVYDALYAWRRHAAGEVHTWTAAGMAYGSTLVA